MPPALTLLRGSGSYFVSAARTAMLTSRTLAPSDEPTAGDRIPGLNENLCPSLADLVYLNFRCWWRPSKRSSMSAGSAGLSWETIKMGKKGKLKEKEVRVQFQSSNNNADVFRIDNPRTRKNQ